MEYVTVVNSKTEAKPTDWLSEEHQLERVGAVSSKSAVLKHAANGRGAAKRRLAEYRKTL